MGFKQTLKFCSFLAGFGSFFLEHGQQTKSGLGPNKKVEENKPALELNFTLKYKWAGHNFDVEYLTEPYCGLLPIAINTNESSSTQLKQPMQLIAAAEQAMCQFLDVTHPCQWVSQCTGQVKVFGVYEVSFMWTMEPTTLPFVDPSFGFMVSLFCAYAIRSWLVVRNLYEPSCRR